MAEQEVQIPKQGRPPARRGGSTLQWILLIAVVVVVIPILACLGFAVVAGLSGTNGTGFGPAVGIVRVEGTIMSGGSANSLSGAIVGSETVVEQLNQANEDPDIKAIVLRINSPGGGVVASDEIHHALLEIEKPIVVSMSELAASGGYYIAAPANYIFATPHTLTGSIGVISEFVTAEEFLDELGVEIIVIAAGEMKDFGNPARDMTDEETAYWRDLLNETHEAFIEVVADGRGMAAEDVRELADGRVFSGTKAIELGLVDELGYFDDAIAKAAELGGIAGEPRLVELAPEPGFLDIILGAQSQQVSIPLELMIRQLTLPVMEFRYLGPDQ